jgi:plastocyanin
MVAQGSNAQAINIVDFDFDARKLTVPVGTTITWTNTGARPHTATDRGGTFDTQPIAPGAQASLNLTVPGTYFYFCRINPSKMNGTVEVQPTPADSKVVRIQTVDDANIQGETLRFDPPNITVKAGTTLLAANAGGKPHTVTADDGSFTTGVITPGPEAGRFPGTNATVQLLKAGTFAYHCEIHPQAMKGTMTVVGEPPPAPPGVTAAGPAAPSAAAITIEDFQFRQPQVSVHAGGQVTFTNAGQAPHTATFDDVPGLDTGTIAPGKSASLKAPDKPGNYSYKCSIHPKMRGVLVVLSDTTPDPVRNVSTTTTGAGPPAASASGQPAPVVTTGAPATKASTASGGVKTWVLLTAVIGSLLAGAGITELLRRRPPTVRDQP